MFAKVVSVAVNLAGLHVDYRYNISLLYLANLVDLVDHTLLSLKRSGPLPAIPIHKVLLQCYPQPAWR